MEFTNQYLTYREYQELGGTLQELPFNLIEFECRKIIDSRTQKRLAEADEIPQEVKLCEFKMINSIDNYQKSLSKNEQGISSENIDGYSISYNGDIENIVKSKASELNDLITSYLFGVIVNNEHLIYIGVK